MNLRRPRERVDGNFGVDVSFTAVFMTPIHHTYIYIYRETNVCGWGLSWPPTGVGVGTAAVCTLKIFANVSRKNNKRFLRVR